MRCGCLSQTTATSRNNDNNNSGLTDGNAHGESKNTPSLCSFLLRHHSHHSLLRPKGQGQRRAQGCAVAGRPVGKSSEQRVAGPAPTPSFAWPSTKYARVIQGMIGTLSTAHRLGLARTDLARVVAAVSLLSLLLLLCRRMCCRRREDCYNYGTVPYAQLDPRT